MAAAPRSMAAPLTTPQHAAGTYRPAEQYPSRALIRDPRRCRRASSISAFWAAISASWPLSSGACR